MKGLGLSLAVVLALFVGTYCNAQTSVTVPVETIDSATGIAVQATVEFKGPESRSVETDRNGRASVSLSPGSYRETITALGYKTVTFNFVVHPGATDNRGGAGLDPIEQPEEVKRAYAQIRPGYTLVAGYAVDDNNHPVADVHVYLQDESAEPKEATTNYKGFFEMSVPSPPGTPMVSHPRNPGDYLPGTAKVIAEKSGYKTQVHTNVPLMNGSFWGVFLRMERGTGTVETDNAPAWLNGTSGTCLGEHACDDIDKTPNHLKAKPGQAAPLPPHSQAEPPKSPGKALVSLGSIIPPDTMIKVGMGCPYQIIPCSPLPGSSCPCSRYPQGCRGHGICTQACSGTPYGPISLEEYVQQGLQWEWKEAWGPPNGPLDGLEAGAVAYRTFGYYRVQHPRSSSYDIRSIATNSR